MAKKKEIEDVKITKRRRVEEVIINQVVSAYETGKSNNDLEDQDFETYMDMFDNVRSERNYDWQSDMAIPEFLNHIQDQSADDANAYFARKEFVSVNVMSNKQEDIDSALSAKELIDKTLSRTRLHFFQKFMRLAQTKNLGGRTYARCWWVQETKDRIVTRPVTRTLDVDEFGNPITSPDQVPARVTENIQEATQEVISDHFDFDVIDPRNIKYSNEYVYDVKDKNWITLRFDTTLDDLKRSSAFMGYINLDQLENVNLSGETETKELTTDRDLGGVVKEDADKAPVKDLMVVESYGKDYAVVNRDESGESVGIDFGYDEDGDVLEGAELIQLIKAVAYVDSKKVLIRHQLQPYKDVTGQRYIPLVRFLCYPHPTNDRGFGDGVGSRDIQTAINDTFNINNDNTMMGTMKMITKPQGIDEDEMPLRIEPMGILPEGVEVVDFPSNTGPALSQIDYLTNKMSQINAREPGIPILSSAAATTVARADKQVTIRSNYKNLVFEKTGMINFYWMILQMSNQFMLSETAIAMIGEEHAANFNAKLDYLYKPVSEAIESDTSTGAKMDRLNTMFGFTVPLAGVVEGAEEVLSEIYRSFSRLLGKEEEQLASAAFRAGGQGQGRGQSGGGGPRPSQTSPAASATNQTGLSQPSGEASAVGRTL